MHKIINLTLLLFIVLLTGCMEIENRIIVQLDSSAIIKETIRVHRELLDFTDESGKSVVLPYLEKAACEERAKAFGTGAVLRSHSLKNLNDGVKISEAEYTIPDINNLYIINPFLCFANFKEMGLAKLVLRPKHTIDGADMFNWGVAGQMTVEVIPEKKGLGHANMKPPTPAVLQKYRDLQPIFKSLMKEFKVSVIFESYAPITTGFGLRDRGTIPRSCEILSFSGANYDKYGGLLLDNDEIMQELLRQKIWDKNLIGTTDQLENNGSVPVICDVGSPYAAFDFGRSTMCISFKPSKQMFDKYFEGKNINTWSVPTPFKAEFEKIGYDPAKDTRKVPAKVAPPVTEPVKTDKPVEETVK